MSDYLRAFLVGAAIVFVLMPVNSGRFSDGLLEFINTAAFGLAGVVAGLVWPRRGWRLGLPLVAFWFLMGTGSILLGLGEAGWDTARDLGGLAIHAMILVAACLGAEVGAIIGRRRGRRAAAARD